MTSATRGVGEVPEVDLGDPEVQRDPVAAYGAARERATLARLVTPGFGAMWAVMRYAEGRAMLSDPRFELNADSYQGVPGVPEDCRPYLRTMQQMDGPDHLRLRRLVAPAFTARRAATFRPRIQGIVDRLLDELPGHVEGDAVDLLRHFAGPLPMDVICELVGIPAADRARWRVYGAAVAAGNVQALAEAIPGVIAGAKAAVAAGRAGPGDTVVSDLIRAQSDDGDRLDDTELVTLVWHIVLAGQVPTHLIANGLETLLSRPEQVAVLRHDPTAMPRAVEELMRWCGPQLLTVPRYAREDVELGGVSVGKGEPVTVAIGAANRDPRVYAEPERLDVLRPARAPAQLGFAHGPHFCLGAALARVQSEVALSAVLGRFPGLALAVPPGEVLRLPDPATWRLRALPVRL